MGHVDFTSPPPVGTKLKLDAQVYLVERLEPYMRRDGVRTTLITWRSLSRLRLACERRP